jgi:hypothetical protein
MSRSSLFRWLAALLISASHLPAQSTARPRPAWVKQGIVMAGNWEPLTFIRRRGGQSMEDEENWKLERTDAVARKLKEAGVNLVVTNFHKGFGLKAEAADIDATRRFVEYAHRRGLRVGGYIGASMMFETFFTEEPDAIGWKQVDERGQPVYYNNAQPYRYMACRNNPGYRAFLEKLMRIGVEDLKLDLIHFDQMESWSEPDTCRCPFCRQQFREFLRDKYTPARRVARFGFDRVDAMLPPPFAGFIASGLAELVNPLMQDWIEFRAASYARRFGEYDEFLYRLNPQVALEGNPNLDASLNKGTRNAVDVGRLLEHGDIVWSEEPQQASWTADGRLVSKIRSFKLARSMGKSLFVYTGGRYGAASSDSPPQLRLAEAMAFNDNNLGMVGDVTPDGVSLTPEARRYIDFFHAHNTVLTGTDSLADVAVLHSFPSIEFNPSEALVSTVLFEQSLIQARIPFHIILDRHLNDLGRYKVLVLANQDAMSDGQVDAVRRFVAQGGGLVITGNTGAMNEWRVRRRRPAFDGLEGRVVRIAAVTPAIDPPAPRLNYRFDNRYWRLPRNHDELIAAVSRAASGRLSVKVEAPPSVAIEIARNRSTGVRLLHLVNYDFLHAVADIAVTLPGSGPAQVVIETPDSGERQALRVTPRDGDLTFRVPRLSTYALVTVTP